MLDFSVMNNVKWWVEYLSFYIKATISISINWGFLPEYVFNSPIYQEFCPTDSSFIETKAKYEEWADKRKNRKGRVIGHKGNFLCLSIVVANSYLFTSVL